MSGIARSLTACFQAVTGAYLRRRYAFLFFTLLFAFVASPLLAVLRQHAAYVELLLAASLLAAVLPIGTGRLWRSLLLVIFVTALAGRLFAASLGVTFSSISLGILVLLGLLSAGNALFSAMRATSIDSEGIYAALSAYLLAGFSFGILYWVLERAWPGSFLYGGIMLDRFSAANGIYFSFVTLATLGYGDFVPRTEVARGLAILEAVAGQLYLGVMVGRLVSLYVSGKAARKKTDPGTH